MKSSNSWLVGMMIAVVISWEVDHSILWATVRGVLGWIWIAYYYHTKTKTPKPKSQLHPSWNPRCTRSRPVIWSFYHADFPLYLDMIREPAALVHIPDISPSQV
jgi:hypothetical protein